MNKLDPTNYGALLREAYRSIEQLQAKIESSERARSEAIAIVGMGCRIPGGANSPEAYWELLRNGVDAVTEIPAERWDVSRYYDPNPEAPGKMSTRWGGFVDHIDQFDAQFFGISPREAISMDPQQRLLLEVAWEALENAGMASESLAGSQTGVYVGISTADYSEILTSRGDPGVYDAYLATGNSHSIASGRLAYYLGLHGPTLSVDTACSSSLVAVYLACQALRSRSCNAALACAVNIILVPEATVTLSKAQMMAADGRCKTFSDDADGFVRGEGCGVVVLKRISDAIAAGDQVLAVIRGGAINQDGRSNGLTAPNGLAQVALIRSALADARVQSSEISYVEAHGTGTPLGDPIEVQAIAEALCKDRSPDNRLMIGSAKTNVGHLESAAGMAGLMKVVMSLQSKQIPAHLHFRRPSRQISWTNIPIDVPTVLTPWDCPSGTRIAGVSSFGFSGSNAHIIVAQAPERDLVEDTDNRSAHLLVLSARTAPALTELIERYVRHFERHGDISLADVCYTAAAGRSHFSHRLALTVQSLEEATEKLRLVLSGEPAEGVSRGVNRQTESPEVAFLFAGEDVRYGDAARKIFDGSVTFRRAVEQCAAVFEQQMEGLHDATYLIDDSKYPVVAGFVIEYSLAQLWRSWGVEPAIVVGSAVGEYAAATVAGVMPLEDAARLVMARSVAAGPIFEALSDVASRVRYSKPCIAWVSAMTGGIVNGAIDPDYWIQQARSTERLADALSVLHDRGIDLAVEIGPTHELVDFAHQRGLSSTGWVSSLCEARDAWTSLLSALGTLYVHGASVNCAGVEKDYSRRPIELPTYPFQRQRFWYDGGQRAAEATIDGVSSLAVSGEYSQALLGERVRCEGSEIRFQNTISRTKPCFLADHVVHGITLVPASGYVEMALGAAESGLGWNAASLAGVVNLEPLPLYGDSNRTLQIVLNPPANGSAKFNIMSRAEEPDEWTRHATGTICSAGPIRSGDDRLLESLRAACPKAVPVEEYYDGARARGLIYGAQFRGIRELWSGNGEAIGRVSLPSSILVEAGHSFIHPVLLDACLQVLGAATPPTSAKSDNSGTYLPIGFECLQIWTRGATELWSHALIRESAGGAEVVTVDLRFFEASGHPAGILTGLILKRATAETVRSAVLKRERDDDFYEESWEPKPTASTGSASTLNLLSGGTQLIVAFDDHCVASLAELLRARGVRVVIARPGSAWHRESNESVTVSPNRREDWRRLISECSSERDRRGVVVLCTADTSTVPVDLDVFRGVVYLAQAISSRLEDSGLEDSRLRVWVVTAGAQSVGSPRPVSLSQAPLIGFARALAIEQVGAGWVRVDLDPDASSGTNAAALTSEFVTDDAENEIALRGGLRYVRRMNRVRTSTSEVRLAEIRSDATYLITGGFGGIGLILAKWLAERGARHLVLTGRGGPRDDSTEIVASLNAQGVYVRSVKADVADETQMQTLLSDIAQSMPPLAGVIHSAGVLDDGLIDKLTWENFARVFAPKIQGAWIVHRLTQGLRLDFFMLFSSAASFFGSPGQSNYAAANAFLDALARHRNAMGLPALSVNWGGWKEIGMTAGLDKIRSGRWGAGAIDAKTGHAALNRLLRHSEPEIVVMPINWGALDFAEVPLALRPLLTEFLDEMRTKAETRSSKISSAILLGLPAEQCDQRIADHVAQTVASILAMRLDTVEPDQPLAELGFDSLMALELKNRLERDLGSAPPMARLLNATTVKQLARLVAEKLLWTRNGEDAAELPLAIAAADIEEGEL